MDIKQSKQLNSNSLFPISLAVLAFLVSVAYLAINRKAKDLPPGPTPAPFVGNRNQVPRAKPWRWFRDLNIQYGDVVFLQIGGTPTIVLGSAQAAWDLLEKKSDIYSSRPRFIMGQELLSNNMRGLMSPYGDFWRSWRRAVHGGFMQRVSDTYRPLQMLESSVLMQDLVESPERYVKHLERYAASVVVCVTYGRRVLDYDSDEVVIENEAAMDFLTSVNIPGKYAVESFPVLKYLPSLLAPWKKAALVRRQRDIDLYTGLVNQVKEKMKRGIAPPSFTRSLIENQKKNAMSDLEIAYASATPFGAGVETTAGTLLSFVLACAAFGPNFIPKAREELDRVVGPDRLPTFDDYKDLPYTCAVLAETLRWRPVAVLGGTPHAVIEEDVYKGMRIPKGSTVIANLWSIHLNDKDFPDPHHFKPERFLEKRDYPGQFGHSAFGFGRRICPGMWIGSNSVFINLARILWGFNVSKAKDASGKEIDVDIFAFTDGFNSRPLPFPLAITPRDDHRKRVIEHEWEDANEQLSAYIFE